MAKLVTVLLLSTALTACSSLALINRTSPTGHYQRNADIAYGSHPRQQLDVYVPKEMSDAAPLVVFFYGGGWKDGSREQYAFVASSLAKSGIVVVIPDYGLYPHVQFPAFVRDGAAAVAWSLDNAELYGADPRKVVVMGHSAGAHIAALVSLDERYLAELGVNAGVIAGLIGLSGPYDFLPLERGYLQQVFPEDTRDDSQPVNFVSAAGPPTLLIHGSDDDTVRVSNSHSMAAALRESGVEVTLKIYDGVGHARVVAGLAPRFRFLSDTLDDCRAFITSVMREP